MATAKKFSRKREAILTCLRGTTCHPTAEWVYQQLKPEYPDLSLGTVYRNLNLLADAGEILSIKTPGGSRFDRTIEPHAHIICSSCGRVIDVPLPFDTQLDTKASEQIGWNVTSHYTIFEGLCPDCR